MTEATATAAPKSDEVKAREAEIVTAALAWGQAQGFGAYGYGVSVTDALRAVGLGEHLPRTTAEVKVHVAGTVTVKCGPDGTWTQDEALRALQSAVYANRAIVEATEVEPTGAPAAE